MWVSWQFEPMTFKQGTLESHKQIWHKLLVMAAQWLYTLGRQILGRVSALSSSLEVAAMKPWTRDSSAYSVLASCWSLIHGSVFVFIHRKKKMCVWILQWKRSFFCSNNTFGNEFKHICLHCQFKINVSLSLSSQSKHFSWQL